MDPIDPEGPETDEGGSRWYASLWFWTIVGVLVAGGAATAVALTWPAAPQEGSLGSGSLE